MATSPRRPVAARGIAATALSIVFPLLLAACAPAVDRGAASAARPGTTAAAAAATPTAPPAPAAAGRGEAASTGAGDALASATTPTAPTAASIAMQDPAPLPAPQAAPAPTKATRGRGGATAIAGDTAPLDDACQVDADCTVKDVGSCCGYNPRCLNHASTPDPAAARARCAQDGRVGICGFREVSGCQCVSGHCAAQSPPGGGLVQ